jgi:hypothetical protein
LCADCEPRCTTDPDRVMAEHPWAFARPDIQEPEVPDPTADEAAGPPPRHDRPRVGTRPPSYASVSGSSFHHVVVTDIQMPFTAIVRFMVKWTMASLPATMIVVLLGMIASLLLRALLGGFDPQPFTTRQF